MSHRILILALAFATGIAGVRYPLLWIFLFAAGFPFLIIYKEKRAIIVAFMAAALIGSGYSWLYTAWKASDISAHVAQETVTGIAEGRIVSDVTVDGDAVRFEALFTALHVSSVERTLDVREKVMVRTYVESEREQRFALQLEKGDAFRARVTLERPSLPRNPGAFDYRSYLANRHIHWVAELDSIRQFKRLPEESGHWLALSDRLGERFERIFDRLYPQQTSALLKGMILGDRQAVEQENIERFRDVGLLHLLAISGLHIGLISALIYGLFIRLHLTRETAVVITILLILIYVLLTGASPSAVRAGTMLSLIYVALLWKRKLSVLDAMGAAAMLMLLYDPLMLWDIGFQLSFIVTAGLILTVPLLARSIPFGPSAWKNALAVVAAAQLFSFPLSIFYFHQFSLFSFVANLVLVPVYSLLIIPPAFISLILGSIHIGFGYLLARFVSGAVEMTDAAMRGLQRVNHIHLYWAEPSIWWMTTYFLLLFSLMYTLKRVYRMRAVFFLSLALFVCCVLYAYNPAFWNDSMRVTFLDVGQGDSAVLEFPDGHVMLVDGGGTASFFEKEAWAKRKDPFQIGEDVILEYLKYRGINHIDTVVITHGDADHINGMSELLDRVSVGRIISNGKKADTDLEKALWEKIRDNGIPVYHSEAGKRWTIEKDVRLTFLYPPKTGRDFSRAAVSDNRASVVFLLEAYKRKMLFAGDIEADGELRMLERFDLPRVDILKVGHHGSDTSTSQAWLKAIRPQWAVISVGRNNRYGHPDPDVLGRLEAAGTRILRTDRHGGVTVRFHARGMEIQPTIRRAGP